MSERSPDLAEVATGARIHAAPPRIHGFGTFPTRAYAVIEA